jgi:hypothetical protein
VPPSPGRALVSKWRRVSFRGALPICSSAEIDAALIIESLKSVS